jgi:hypothetical protein
MGVERGDGGGGFNRAGQGVGGLDEHVAALNSEQSGTKVGARASVARNGR